MPVELLEILKSCQKKHEWVIHSPFYWYGNKLWYLGRFLRYVAQEYSITRLVIKIPFTHMYNTRRISQSKSFFGL